MVLDLGKKQIKLIIDISKTKLNQIYSKDIDYPNPWLWLNGWANKSLGFQYLDIKYFEKNKSIKLFILCIKNILKSLKISGFNLHFNGKFGDYNALMVSWCFKSDFKKDGVFHDRYFNISSVDDANVFWFLISIDGYIPEQLVDNICILKQKKISLKNNFSFFLNNFLPELWKSKFKWIRIFHTLVYESLYAKAIAREVFLLKSKGYIFDRVIQPYEAQPYQNEINRLLKIQNPHIKTIGYIHSTIPPLPTCLIKRNGAPEYLFVHGFGQLEILSKLLGWHHENLFNIPSLRYQLKKEEKFGGWIFLPYDFDQNQQILQAFELFLSLQLPDSLPVLNSRCHPARIDSIVHIELIENIENLMKKYKNRFSLDIKDNYSIFIGATSAVIEALERGVDVVHISTRPIFETYQSDIWNYLSVEQINPQLFKYKLLKKGSYIQLGMGTSQSFDRILKI
jgi:hypothetical protein